MGQLRAALVAMSAVLASYGFALGLTHLAGLHVDIVVLAVAIAVTLERTQRTRAPDELLTRCRLIIDTISEFTDDPEQPNSGGNIQAATDELGQEITRLRRHRHRESA